MKELTHNELAKLRAKGIVAEHEIAYLQGNVLVIKNLLTDQKRIEQRGMELITESSRTLLKG